MDIITAGHSYGLADFETGEITQDIHFIHKEKSNEESGEMITVNPGTTNEEVLEVLINRTEYLDNKFPDKWNLQGILHLRMALECFENRTRERIKRKVEGLHKA